jgi:hypothetical protein
MLYQFELIFFLFGALLKVVKLSINLLPVIAYYKKVTAIFQFDLKDFYSGICHTIL